MTNERREPFKEPPLRQPGESGLARVRERLKTNLGPTIACFVAIGFLIGVNVCLLTIWLLTWLFTERAAIHPSIAFGVPVVITLAMLVFGSRMLRRLDESAERAEDERLGARGERVVADALDELKRDGYHVFHDVPPEREACDGERLANFDHIVIGPAGVFVIETKTRSIANGSNEVVITTDGRVLVNKIQPDRCPIRQATTLAGAMQRTLEQDTGMANLPVRPVVVFPGRWFIKDREYREAGGDVWTLTETAFAKWVRSPKESVRLTPAEIEQLASCVSKRCRVAGQ